MWFLPWFSPPSPLVTWAGRPLAPGALHCAGLLQAASLPRLLPSLRPEGPVVLVDLDGLWAWPSPWPGLPTWLLRAPPEASLDLLGQTLARHGAFSVVLWLWSASPQRPRSAWAALPALARRHRRTVWVAVGAGPTPWRCSWLSCLRYQGSVLE